MRFSVKTASASPLRAGLLAIAAGSTLGGARYALESDAIGSVVVGAAVALILFLMLGFPDLANRRLSWRRPESAPAMTLRRAIIRVGVPGAMVVGLALWLQSVMLIALAAVYFAFWSVLIYSRRRRLGS
jgi:hypothetical protein